MDPASILSDIWAFLTYIPPFLLVLGVVVFVHEYGHYIVGRWCGIQAEVFSIGFGRTLFAWTDRRGTRWQVAALPLGGYVKFVGDMDPASAGKVDDDELSAEQRKVAFHAARLPNRAATVLAGPVFNFVLSILVFAALAMAAGQSSTEPVIAEVTEEAPEGIGFEAGDRVLAVGGEEIETFPEILRALHSTDGEPVPATVERGGTATDITVRYSIPPEVDSITPGMPASGAGILPGDRILSIDGEEAHSFFALQMLTVDLPPGKEITVGIERDGERMEVSLVPEMRTRTHPVTGERMELPTLGISSHARGGLRPMAEWIGPVDALWVGAVRTWDIIDGTVTFLGDIVFANADPGNIGGPIRIAEMSGDQAAKGVMEFIGFIAVLSTAIGFLNLLPIPVLDGGHLLFYAIEGVTGRPVGGALLQIGTAIGLAMVLSLMVFATYNDLARVLAG